MSFVSAPMVSSENGDWQTPAEVLDLVRELGGGAIDLDPATVATNPVGARAILTPAEDGLAHNWARIACGGLTWINPPYGRAIVPWTRKLRLEGAAGCELVSLVPARTDTAWWQDDITTAAAVCFWRGRLKFVGAKDPAPFPSAIAYWGRRVEAFARVFGARGWITGASAPHSLPKKKGGGAADAGHAVDPAPRHVEPAPKRLQIILEPAP